jgi:ubiquinone biosynthesis monooxygenase Coq7
MPRDYTPADNLLIQLDHALRAVFGRPHLTERPDPARSLPEAELSAAERDHVARLMRINHTGEVCAQALYLGQALTARLPGVRESMARAAAEENDHLDWCERRVHELGGRLSLLNPLFYAGSFLIGAAAGLAGDRWSLGFVAETERQVERHLDEHLAQLPAEDARTHAVLEQMKADEIAHATRAVEAGAATLPAPVREAMRLTAKVMTTAVYRV